MPNAAKNLLLILLIPFLLAAGHDIYLNYFSDDEKIREVKNLQINPKEFMLSDMGWIWQEYSPGSMEILRDMVSKESWTENFDPVLKQPTMLVTIVPFLCGVIALLFAFILGIWPFSRFGQKRREDKAGYGIYKKAKGTKTQYNKK